MIAEDLNKISISYLDKLCNVIGERPVGNVGNRLLRLHRTGFQSL